MVYLDTSMLVAYYCPEALSQQAQSLLSEAVKPALSYLTEVELFSVVAKKVRSKEMGSADGNRILAKFTSHVDGDFYTIIPVENHHWRLARGWIGLFTTLYITISSRYTPKGSKKKIYYRLAKKNNLLLA